MTDIYINHRSSSRRVCALHRSEKASPGNGWPPYDYYLPFILATKCQSSSSTGYGDLFSMYLGEIHIHIKRNTNLYSKTCKNKPYLYLLTAFGILKLECYLKITVFRLSWKSGVSLPTLKSNQIRFSCYAPIYIFFYLYALLIQDISKFLTNLPSLRLSLKRFLGTVSGYKQMFFLADTLQKV